MHHSLEEVPSQAIAAAEELHCSCPPVLSFTEIPGAALNVQLVRRLEEPLDAWAIDRARLGQRHEAHVRQQEARRVDVVGDAKGALLWTRPGSLPASPLPQRLGDGLLWVRVGLDGAPLPYLRQRRAAHQRLVRDVDRKGEVAQPAAEPVGVALVGCGQDKAARAEALVKAVAAVHECEPGEHLSDALEDEDLPPSDGPRGVKPVPELPLADSPAIGAGLGGLGAVGLGARQAVVAEDEPLLRDGAAEARDEAAEQLGELRALLRDRGGLQCRVGCELVGGECVGREPVHPLCSRRVCLEDDSCSSKLASSYPSFPERGGYVIFFGFLAPKLLHPQVVHFEGIRVKTRSGRFIARYTQYADTSHAAF
mmetsp:Transcript_22261/g.53244  ORF Transcript_22261/g.53244 Transcript_22261/m.53244 type:complete len:367 (+) Transcript_22261:219-1319(+)